VPAILSARASTGPLTGRGGTTEGQGIRRVPGSCHRRIARCLAELRRLVSRDDHWKTFFFTAYGYRVDANCASCPKTAALLDTIPGLVTAFFSILSPHKHIPPHRGPYRGVVRCHLALMVPGAPEACGIKVGGEVRHWHEGETMFFDDGYEHSAWNDCDGTRVVLFLDVMRPLRRPAADVNKALLRAIAWSPFLRDAKRRHEAWERRFERLAK
jgi:ornithine lipid ester-linked acyl 2-hydroxylase